MSLSFTLIWLLLQEGPVYFLEGGPLFCVPPPAAQHDLVEWVRTQHRLRQVDLHRNVMTVRLCDKRKHCLEMYIVLEKWKKVRNKRCEKGRAESLLHSPVFSGPWKTPLCFLSPARLWVGSRAAPCRSWESPTGWLQTPTHRSLWWIYPAEQQRSYHIHLWKVLYHSGQDFIFISKRKAKKSETGSLISSFDKDIMKEAKSIPENISVVEKYYKSMNFSWI